jgi:hypothetical protein
MVSAAFWDWFNREPASKLGLREISFRKIFAYLDTFDIARPIAIIETGCLRQSGNWEGDGQSTLLFDRYLSLRGDSSRSYAVDIDPAATAVCKAATNDSVVDVRTGDSVVVLRDIVDSVRERGLRLALLYLDSYDLDWNNATPSAVHHLKELVSAYQIVTPQTLVVVDDAPLEGALMFGAADQVSFLKAPVVGGKGKYVAEYATQVGAATVFSHYQAGWTGFR